MSSADQTETQLREWVLKRNGDPLTPKDFVAFGLAIDADGVARHEETIRNLEPMLACLEDHEKRLATIEVKPCLLASDAATIFTVEHEARHERHMQEGHDPRRSNDPDDANHRGERRGFTAPVVPAAIEQVGRRVWVMWGVGLWLATVAGTAIINWLVGGIHL